MVVHPDAAVRNVPSDRGRIVRAVNAVVGLAEPHPERSERASGVRHFIDNGKMPGRRLRKHFAYAYRIRFDYLIAVQEIEPEAGKVDNDAVFGHDRITSLYSMRPAMRRIQLRQKNNSCCYLPENAEYNINLRALSFACRLWLAPFMSFFSRVRNGPSEWMGLLYKRKCNRLQRVI